MVRLAKRCEPCRFGVHWDCYQRVEVQTLAGEVESVCGCCGEIVWVEQVLFAEGWPRRRAARARL